MHGRVRIGISGWRYKGWRSVFYPKGLAQRRELEYASRQFDSIEINGTFYSLQRPEYFRDWAAQTPDDFVFALKGGRFITHMLKLRGVEGALANYFASGPLALGAKMGPILWQFPPQLRWDRERFESFFALLPRTTGDAAALARGCSEKVFAHSFLEATVDLPIRHCVEIRHESFAVPEFIEVLRCHRIGLVVADTVEWPLLMDVTADFVYCRLHGSEELYASGYEDVALDLWASRVHAWAAGRTPADRQGNARYASGECAEVHPRDVFVYFDNDAKVRAPFDALGLQQRVHTAR
ncbi:MAG: DUF72 domain-containing protein [Acidobacteriota bacterium]|nr:DUF72 domain-containing protein [Acidobacteriota bacterium]